MNLSQISKNPRAIKALTGLSYEEFTNLSPVFKEAEFLVGLDKKGRQRKPGGGRRGILKTTEERLFFVLFYLKTYPTFHVLGFLFGLQRGHACEHGNRYMKVLEKALGRQLVLPERRISSVEEFIQKFPEVKEVFVDGVERRIQRPKNTKSQNKTYSGKKKTHTRKNIAMTDSKKRILVLTPTKSGRRHDKRIADKFLIAEHLPESVLLCADSGFAGVQHIHENTWIPAKGSKKKPLTVQQKQDNVILSHFRVCVEHAFSGVKRFWSCTNVLRNRKGQTSDLFILLGCGLWNYHLQQST